MKNLLSIVVLSLFITDASADWRLKKFDENNDGFIKVSELQKAGCKVNIKLFTYADKNSDGKLNAKEAGKASKLLKLNKCERGF